MMTKTSQQLKDEATTTFYGINPTSLVVESVGLTRGGTLTYWQADKLPSVYRIKGGLPPREEVERVFRLTDIVGISSRAESIPGETDHPLIAALQRTAAGRRNARDIRLDIDLSSARANAAVTHERAQYPDHRLLSEHDHTAAHHSPQEGIHPLAGLAVASAGWLRSSDPSDDAL